MPYFVEAIYLKMAQFQRTEGRILRKVRITEKNIKITLKTVASTENWKVPEKSRRRTLT